MIMCFKKLLKKKEKAVEVKPEPVKEVKAPVHQAIGENKIKPVAKAKAAPKTDAKKPAKTKKK